MTREQEIQELDIGLAKAAVERLNGMADMSCLAEASGVKAVIDDITYLLARVATLEAELNQQFIDQSETVWTRPTAEAYALTCKALHAAQATNAQRDARLVRAGLEAAAKECDHWYEDSVLAANNCFEGRDQGSAIIHKEQADAYHRASAFIRALATDDAAIQAAVEKM